MNNKIRAVVICGSQPRHMYFANIISRYIRVEAIIVQPSTSLDFERERKYFFKNYKNSFADISICSYIYDVNKSSIVEDLKPDVIFTFGCGILKKDIFFDIPKLGIINLHSGVTPDYRGVDNVYWCMYNNEFNKIGFTIHYVERGIDTGNVISQKYVEFDYCVDDEVSMFNKVIENGILEFKSLVKHIDRGNKIVSKPINNKGKLYQNKDRTLETDRVTKLNINRKRNEKCK